LIGGLPNLTELSTNGFNSVFSSAVHIFFSFSAEKEHSSIIAFIVNSTTLKTLNKEKVQTFLVNVLPVA